MTCVSQKISREHGKKTSSHPTGIKFLPVLPYRVLPSTASTRAKSRNCSSTPNSVSNDKNSICKQCDTELILTSTPIPFAKEATYKERHFVPNENRYSSCELGKKPDQHAVAQKIAPAKNLRHFFHVFSRHFEHPDFVNEVSVASQHTSNAPSPDALETSNRFTYRKKMSQKRPKGTPDRLRSQTSLLSLPPLRSTASLKNISTKFSNYGVEASNVELITITSLDKFLKRKKEKKCAKHLETERKQRSAVDCKRIKSENEAAGLAKNEDQRLPTPVFKVVLTKKKPTVSNKLDLKLSSSVRICYFGAPVSRAVANMHAANVVD